MANRHRVVDISFPEVTAAYAGDDQGLSITVELPGVGKEDVDLTVSKAGFCISTARAARRYEGCFSFGHEVDSTAARARMDNGRLLLTVPFLEPGCARKVEIE